MRHPWATRRERAGFTQDSVAGLLGVNRQTVIRLEQSLFHAPSVEVLVKLGEYYSVPIGDLIEEYNEYVKTKRSEFGQIHASWDVLRHYSGAEHPLVHYRGELLLSRLAFCRELCLDYGPVADYEKNKQRGIPLELIRASEDMHWDYAPLESAVAEWRANGRADKSKTTA